MICIDWVVEMVIMPNTKLRDDEGAIVQIVSSPIPAHAERKSADFIWSLHEQQLKRVLAQ